MREFFRRYGDSPHSHEWRQKLREEKLSELKKGSPIV